MKLHTILSALTFLGAASAMADGGSWYLQANYNYTFDTTVSGDTASFGDLEVAMTVNGVDGSYTNQNWKTGGYGVNYPSDSAFDFMSTDGAEPVLNDSFLMGVLTDANQTQHLVLFMNPTAAGNISGTPYDGVFATSAQPDQYTEGQVIGALTDLHGGGTPAHQDDDYSIIYNFEDQVARNANVGTNGTLGDAWFTADQGFSIVEFSNGVTVGSGTVSVDKRFTPVPEPASMLALGVGAVGVLRRRKRA